MKMAKPTTKTETIIDDARIATAIRDESSLHVALFSVSLGRIQFLDQTSCDGTELKAWLIGKQCGRLVAILPAGDTHCPAVQIPLTSLDAAEVAAGLQLETAIARGTPEHRASVGVAPDIRTRTGRIALLSIWTANGESDSWTASLVDALPSCQVTFVAPAALTMFVVNAATAEAESPLMACCCDATSGTLAITLAGAGVANSRTTHAAVSNAHWHNSVRETVRETAMLAGWPDLTTDATAHALSALELPTSGVTLFGIGFDIRRVLLCEGMPDGGEWWNRFGPLVVAAELASTQSSLKSLVSMRERAPRVQGGRLAVIGALLSEPKVALRVGVIGIVLAALLPMGFAWLRLSILESRCEHIESLDGNVRKSEQKLAMYRDFSNHSWPITKLISDIAATTPEAIEIRSLVLSQGDGVTIRGEAKAAGTASGADAILDMERLMRGSHVFDRVTKDWDPSDARGITKFSVSATVSRASFVPRYPEAQDFAALTMRERRYGPSDDEATAVVPTPTPTAELPTAEATAETTARGGTARPSLRDAAAGAQEGVARRGAPITRPVGEAQPIPPALTQDEVGAMSLAETNAAMNRYATARHIDGLDDETKARLRQDFDMLMAHLQKVKQK